MEAIELTGDERPEEDSEQQHRYDGPWHKFAKVDRTGYGSLASDIERLDAAISAAQSGEVQDLKLAEELLEDWLRRRNNSKHP